jgi:hypothetical protein
LNVGIAVSIGEFACDLNSIRYMCWEYRRLGRVKIRLKEEHALLNGYGNKILNTGTNISRLRQIILSAGYIYSYKDMGGPGQHVRHA